MAPGVLSEAVASGPAFVGVMLLAAMAPFELTRPVLRLPWQSLSNLEAAVVLACGVWGAAIVVRRGVPVWRTPIAVSWAAFVGAMAVASAAAVAFRVNAWHMTGRIAAALAVYLLTVDGVRNRPRLQAGLTLSVVSAVIVGLLAIGEYLHVEPVLNALRLFRPDVIAVGAQIRAGGPLQYPTIASMYLEVAFAFGLGLLLVAIDQRRQWRVALVFAALVVIAEGITVTFTRAGLITIAVSLALVAWWRHRQTGFDRALAIVGALAIVIVALLIASRSTQWLWLRMTSESQESWYRADVDAPSQLAFATDGTREVPLTVRNTGRLVWDSQAEPPILLSYHWLLPDGSRVVAYEGSRTEFASPVRPGTVATVRAQVRAPRHAGEYRLVWDLVQEGHLWFSTEPGAGPPALTRAVVSGPSLGGPLVTTDLPRVTHRPGRFVLWRAAVRMAAAHPLVGVGPDNFRLLYGSFAGLPAADPRTHSNNMYLEVLSGGGLLGLVTFCWFLTRTVRTFCRPLHLGTDPGQTRDGPGTDRGQTRDGPGTDPGRTRVGYGSVPDDCGRALGVGLAAAGLAIALHGFVDSFLSFAPTYILFALTLGFADAYRV